MKEVLATDMAKSNGDSLATQQCNLLAPEYEYLDPNPDLHSLFQEYNCLFFEGRLAGCEVKWSKRMTLCAGLCSFQRLSGFCSIRLSEPLLKLRPRSDMVNTLLHEMIHAYVFVGTSVRDHEDHGPLFQSHMNRINEAAKTKITVFHTFHDEVNSYRQHVWQCTGPCRRTRPYFGLVKRSMNRCPGPKDRWWADHLRSCGGNYIKIKEPKEFTAKQAKKRERELAREEKLKKKRSLPSVKPFFSAIQEGKIHGVGDSAQGDFKTSRAEKNDLFSIESKSGSRMKPTEKRDDRKSLKWPVHKAPPSVPNKFSALGSENVIYIVEDIQGLFHASALQSGRKKDGLKLLGAQNEDVYKVCSESNHPATEDLISEDSDSEQLREAIRLSLETTDERSHVEKRTKEVDIIEID
ncbi:Uncharacterized conserved protein [Plasmopara halstedii]|uniref:Uncharacterized conserved protein n=1 Tax=Plasmopara halstedii TaxID=4781 RepID=A0A0P1B336_PLAHL|nr:Uncharacterized conserved protein [Plasmopara halstedii]CEG47873.1 Uncharacterized conserved protein [Plasmopara halstedii]|eukprot:XP_024584242.1 Uncharacterized conserved protein [Plasmopara halstedii]